MAERDNTALFIVGAAAVLGLVAMVTVTGAAVATAVVATQGAWRVRSQKVIDRMGADQKAFMDRLRSALPAHIPLTVSSSFRTPGEQASAMRTKLREGATLEDLRKLYGNSGAINEVLATPPEAWEAVIAAQVARGTFLSRHLRHDALDLSVKLPDSDVYMARPWQDAIVAAALASGAARAFVEDDPPHIHIERIGPPGAVTSGVGSASVYSPPSTHYGMTATKSAKPGEDTWGGVPKGILKKTVWRYIDFLTLYRNLSARERADFLLTYERADGETINQMVIDFNDEVSKEAKARGMKSKEIVAEFEARAAQAGLPSATGVLG